jgi:hypothetical protein
MCTHYAQHFLCTSHRTDTPETRHNTDREGGWVSNNVWAPSCAQSATRSTQLEFGLVSSTKRNAFRVRRNIPPRFGLPNPMNLSIHCIYQSRFMPYTILVYYPSYYQAVWLACCRYSTPIQTPRVPSLSQLHYHPKLTPAADA